MTKLRIDDATLASIAGLRKTAISEIVAMQPRTAREVLAIKGAGPRTAEHLLRVGAISDPDHVLDPRPTKLRAPHDIALVLATEAQAFVDAYTRAARWVRHDAGTAGDQGEENWASLLRRWLPASAPVVTKGRLVGADGALSPQIDVIVLDPAYPPALLDQKLYLADGVLAAFECKRTARKHLVRRFVTNATQFDDLAHPRSGSPVRELLRPFLYGLLAHTSESVTAQDVDHILQEQFEKCDHPSQLVDLVCIADLGCWTSFRSTWLGPETFGDGWEKIRGAYGGQTCVGAGFMVNTEDSERQREGWTTVGDLVAFLMRYWTLRDPGSRWLANSMRRVAAGHGGGPFRTWPVDDVYSAAVRGNVHKLDRGDPNWELYFS